MDIELYESVVKRCTSPLYKYCSKRLRHNRQLTEEAVNDTLRILFEKWDMLDITDDIMRYLYRVADNCIMQARARDNKYYSIHAVSLEELEGENAIDKVYCFDDYFHDAESEDKFISDMMDSLPDEYKNIFRYRYVEKMIITDVSKIVHIPYSSLRLRLKKIEEYVTYQVANNY